VRQALRTAFAEGGLIVHYQPEVSLHTGLCVAVESLVRLPNSALGALQPDEFVAVAERTGQIHELGRVVLDMALTDTGPWTRSDPDHPPLVTAINVSPDELLRSGFAKELEAQLVAREFDPRRLCLEITETAVVDAIDPVVRVLDELHSLGVSIAIDDFGTGHASLRHLARFPADTVKIDRTFVAGIAKDEPAEIIVESVIEMAHSLGKVVVAEGVETPVQLERLIELGCDIAQGYLFSRPVPPAEAAVILERGVTWPAELTGRRTQRRADRRRPDPAVIPPADPALRYRLLTSASRAITAAGTLEETLANTFAALRVLVDFTGGSIQLVQGSDLALAATDPPATPEALGARVPLGTGVGGQIAATGEPRYIPDITQDADVPASRRKASVSGGVRSYFGVPLATYGRILGLLQIDSVEVDAFSIDDQTLVLAIAPIVAAALMQTQDPAIG
jgi:EAL domain-containing protein (putative c-di-GMP-specific phosphodiesterase class I)/putative methionine-R-sulfoxide reductase with GAF domain